MTMKKKKKKKKLESSLQEVFTLQVKFKILCNSFHKMKKKKKGRNYEGERGRALNLEHPALRRGMLPYLNKVVSSHFFGNPQT